MKLNNIYALLILAGAIVVLLLAVLRRPRPDIGSYRASALMTDNELEFFGRLVKAVPEYYVFPQVALSAILQPDSRNRKKAYADFLRIAQQRVDYLICRADGSVVAVVELDDRTHSAARDEIRDARLWQGGIDTIRFESRKKPGIAALREALLA